MAPVDILVEESWDQKGSQSFTSCLSRSACVGCDAPRGAGLIVPLLGARTALWGLGSPPCRCFAVIRAKAVSAKEVDSGNDIYGNPIKRIQYEIKQIKVTGTSRSTGQSRGRVGSKVGSPSGGRPWRGVLPSQGMLCRRRWSRRKSVRFSLICKCLESCADTLCSHRLGYFGNAFSSSWWAVSVWQSLSMVTKVARASVERSAGARPQLS